MTVLPQSVVANSLLHVSMSACMTSKPLPLLSSSLTVQPMGNSNTVLRPHAITSRRNPCF